jgi:uncharacterized OB-fold protein
MSGCVSSYQDTSSSQRFNPFSTGGAEVQDMKLDQYVVTYTVTPSTPRETAEKFIAYRCAELAKEKGFEGFQTEIPFRQWVKNSRGGEKVRFGTRIRLVHRPFPEGKPVSDATEIMLALQQFISAHK